MAYKAPAQEPSRADVRSEMVASLLWMHLELPHTVSRTELESFADTLIQCAGVDDPALAIERRLTAFQSTRLIRPVDAAAIIALRDRVLQLLNLPSSPAHLRRTG